MSVILTMKEVKLALTILDNLPADDAALLSQVKARLPQVRQLLHDSVTSHERYLSPALLKIAAIPRDEKRKPSTRSKVHTPPDPEKRVPAHCTSCSWSGTRRRSQLSKPCPRCRGPVVKITKSTRHHSAKVYGPAL